MDRPPEKAFSPAAAMHFIQGDFIRENFMRNIRHLMLGAMLLVACRRRPLPGAFRHPAAAPFVLTSSSFQDGGVIPDKYTQAVPNPISPALSWINTPAGTVSFVLIMHDPDTAPRKSMVDILHWMAFSNIPGTANWLPGRRRHQPELA